MPKAFVFNQPGPAENLRLIDLPKPDLKANEVLIRQKAIGVNFIDILYRSGRYPIEGTPKSCGSEACGIIEAIGSEVKGFEVGQRVAYATFPTPGAYAEYRAVPADYIFAVPDFISDRTVAASMLKGLTAHYLATRVFIAKPGVSVLIHSAAGGVGQLLSQWCKKAGALVIGTIGDENKRQAAEKYCHKVVNYNSLEWVKEVKSFTKNIGISAVYDGIGATTFQNSLDVLMPMGIMVLYGQSSGEVAPVDLKQLKAKSLFLTCPSLFEYKKNRMELVLSAQELFLWIQDGSLKIEIPHEFPFSQAVEAHKLIESRKSIGSVVLTL